jgi:outer membrane protein TolC
LINKVGGAGADTSTTSTTSTLHPPVDMATSSTSTPYVSTAKKTDEATRRSQYRNATSIAFWTKKISLNDAVKLLEEAEAKLVEAEAKLAKLVGAEAKLEGAEAKLERAKEHEIYLARIDVQAAKSNIKVADLKIQEAKAAEAKPTGPEATAEEK